VPLSGPAFAPGPRTRQIHFCPRSSAFAATYQDINVNRIFNLLTSALPLVIIGGLLFAALFIKP